MDGRFGLGLIALIVVAVFVGVLLAQSQPQTAAAPQPTSAPTPIPTPAPLTVDIQSNPGGNPSAVYNPSPLTVSAGQKVTWVNMDSQPHSVTFDDGSHDSGVLVTGQKWSWRATKPGTYGYGDFLNPTMHGTVTVQ